MVTQLEDRSVPAKISGNIFFDLNADGMHTPPEAWAENLAVSCTTEGGTVLPGATTDSGGYYEFLNLTPGNYALTFTPPPGHSFGMPVGGSSTVPVSTMDVIQNASLVMTMVPPPPVSPPPLPVFPPPISPPPPPISFEPGANHWISASSNGGTSDWMTGSNWSLGRMPVPGDDVYFDNANTLPANNNIGGMVKSLHVLSNYTQTISMTIPFMVGTLEMSPGYGGKIDQVGGYSLTVTTALNWTSGTINSTASLGDLVISGATALIAPENGGTVYTGSNIKLVNGASATTKEGSVQVTNAEQEINVGENCSYNVDPTGSLTSQIVGLFKKKFVVGPNATFTVNEGKDWRHEGKVYNFGTFILKGDAFAKVTGLEDDPYAYSQSGSTNYGATYLYGSSILSTPVTHNILIQGGKFATMYASTEQSANDCSATIMTKQLKITSGDIYIGYGGPHLAFGTLTCHGSVDWSGGTYHPVVRSYGQEGQGESDLWYAIDSFTVTGGAGWAALAPIVVDSEGAQVFQPPTWWITYTILRSDRRVIGNEDPTMDTNSWSIVRVSVDDTVRKWNLKDTGPK